MRARRGWTLCLSLIFFASCDKPPKPHDQPQSNPAQAGNDKEPTNRTKNAGANSEQNKSGQQGDSLPETTTEAYDSQSRGALQVTGDTDDWFMIYQDGKRVGPRVAPKLGSTEELPPGAYEVRVNKTSRNVNLEAGKKIIVRTGSLVVEGQGEWYTPYQDKEAKISSNPPALNNPIALFPGAYEVRVHVGQKDESLGDATVSPGKKTVLKK
jgi:hypothetical protein